MAENSFLTGMKLEQFIKTNNEQMQQNLNNAFGPTATNVADILRFEKISAKKLIDIDKNVSDIPTMNKTITKIYDLQKKSLEAMSSSDKNLTKTIDSLMSKQDTRMSTMMTQMSKKEKVVEKVSTTKDMFKREKPGEERDEYLESISGGISSLIGLEKKKKKGKGLLGALGLGLGALLSVGGLAGFLLTGKKEYLFSVAKGLKTLLKPLIKSLSVLGGIPKMLASIPTILAKIQESTMKFGASVKGVGKNIKTFATGIKTLGVKGSLVKGAKGIGAGIKGLGTGTKGLKAGLKGVFKGGAKTGAKVGAKRIPIVGSLMGIGFGVSRMMKGDIAGGFMEFGSAGLGALDMVAPGVGTALSLAADTAIMARDFKRSANANKGPKGDALLPSRNKKQSKHPLRISPFGLQTSKSKKNEYGEGGPRIGGNMFRIPDNVDMKGIRPDVWNNFYGMASEYYNKTGNQIQINSAFRSPDKQKELWDLYKRGVITNPVAYPGRSMHEYGYAIDINSDEANEMDSLGIMGKWGFDRPVKRGTSDWEPWHVEPTGLEYAKVRSGVGVADMNQMGDAISPVKISSSSASSNLPSGNVPRPTPTTSNESFVRLTTEDIDKLATAFGRQIRENTPTPQRNITPVGNGNARSNI